MGLVLVGGNEWNYINLNEHEEHEEEEEKDLSRTALIVKKKSQSKSVMDAGGGTGSNPLSLPPSLQEAKKKIKIWGPYTETLPNLRRKKTVHPALPQKKKREKYKKYEHIEHGRGM